MRFVAQENCASFAPNREISMTLPHDHIDPQGLQEFSVVFTDRSLNHMSARFQGVMRDI
jgi:hypothetical protein